MLFKPKMSKIFVVKIPKNFDNFFFNLEKKLGVESKKNGLEMQKNTSLFFKNIGFALRFLWFCVAKPIILESKTYGFGV